MRLFDSAGEVRLRDKNIPTQTNTYKLPCSLGVYSSDSYVLVDVVIVKNIAIWWN